MIYFALGEVVRRKVPGILPRVSLHSYSTPRPELCF